MASTYSFSKWVLHFYSILYWLVFLFYLWGGMVIDGRLRLNFVHDIFRTASILSILALILGVNLQKTHFIQSWKNLLQSIEKKQLPQTLGAWLVGVGVLYLMVLFFWIPISRHHHFLSFTYDLGLFNNIIARGAAGLGMTTPLLGSSENPFNYLLNNHLNFALYPIAWLYKIFPYTEFLLLLQSFALLSAAYPLYKLGQRLLPSTVSPWILVFLYWFFDPIHRNNIWDFHENKFIVVFCLWSYYFFIQKRWYWSAFFLIGVGIWKEDAWVLAGGMAFYYFFTYRRYTYGVLSLLLGLLILFGYSFLFNKVNDLGGRYEFLGNGFESAIQVILYKPWLFVAQLMRPEVFYFTLRLLGHCGGAILFIFLSSSKKKYFNFWILVPFVLIYLELTLSSFRKMLGFEDHYILTLTGPFFFLTVVGIAKIAERWPELSEKKIIPIMFCIAFSNLAFSEAGAFAIYRNFHNNATLECYQDLVKAIPKDAVKIYARDPFGPHLATYLHFNILKVNEDSHNLERNSYVIISQDDRKKLPLEFKQTVLKECPGDVALYLQ